MHTVAVPDTGAWATDVKTFAHRIAAFAADPVDLTLTRIMVSGQHPAFAAAVIRTLVSPLFLAPLTGGEALRPEQIDRLVDLVLDATRPS